MESGIGNKMEDELRQFEKRFDGAPEKEQVLDLSESSEESQQLSEILKNPLLPANLYNVISDKLIENSYGTDSPELILSNLKSKLEKEN